MFGMLMMLIIAYLVSIDANSVGENGTLWFFVVFFLPMMGLFLYLVVRSINRNPGTNSSANYNYSNSVATTPPITEPTKARRVEPSYNKDLSKSYDENRNEFQFCTTCGFQNLTEASFCKSCGIKLI
jgi:hypothetical protein